MSTSLFFDGLRNKFPTDFQFGGATSAYQIEGGCDAGGKGRSIWDMQCYRKGWKGENGIDHYNRYKEDVGLIKWMGLDTYRFSISWARIFPDGKKTSGVNEEGVQFYKDLILELEKNNITPFVTLFHWDLPQALQEDIEGFKNSKIADYFVDYADFCFMEFGDKVKHWITFNEPWTFCHSGYVVGNHAPGRSCDTLHEPYIVAHNQLLAHAKAVDLYRNKYKNVQNGVIGITLCSPWVEPITECENDKKAQDRAIGFVLTWFLEPIVSGKYPEEIEKILNSRSLPTFEENSEESKLVKGSADFLGINYYTGLYVKDDPKSSGDDKVGYVMDKLLGQDWGGAAWLKVYPKGLKDLLLYIKNNINYKGPVYVTENGYSEKNDDELSLNDCIYDGKRVSYFHQHLSQLMQLTDPNAPEDQKVDVKGYFAWSLLDNFEWDDGFDIRFGSIYVDYKNDLKRTPKFSAHWWKYMLETPYTMSDSTQSSNKNNGDACGTKKSTDQTIRTDKHCHRISGRTWWFG